MSYDAADLQRDLQVQDDVLAALCTYVELLAKWQAKINLVGPDTLPDVWRRHVLDSGQLSAYIPIDTGRTKKVVDFGSGAGFPGLVLAALRPDLDVHLVESDQRKCAFLREVNRAAGLGASIHAERIEAMAPLNADVVTSRALASLDKLLAFANMHSLSTGICLFLKGKRWSEELTEAQKSWTLRVQRHPSRTDPAGMILELSECERRHDPME